MATHVIFPAAGIGKRFNAQIPKQHVKISGKTVLTWTLDVWQSFSIDGKRVLVISQDDEQSSKIASEFKNIEFVTGGAQRTDSVYNALCRLAETEKPEDWVLVHDVARPCVRVSDIRKLIDICQATGNGGILCQPVIDTVKQSNPESPFVKTIDRSTLWLAQTPQCFQLGSLLQAFNHVMQDNITITDEASAIEYLGLPVNLVVGSTDNIKLTRPEDEPLIEFYLSQQGR